MQAAAVAKNLAAAARNGVCAEARNGYPNPPLCSSERTVLYADRLHRSRALLVYRSGAESLPTYQCASEPVLFGQWLP
jgi:hypothetical protein